MKYKRILIGTCIAMTVMSCYKFENTTLPDNEQDKFSEMSDLSAIKIKQGNTILFADLSEYTINKTGQTKSIDDDILVSLESLLDRKHQIEVKDGDSYYLQIPFAANEETTFALVDTALICSAQQCQRSVVKKFLFHKKNKDGMEESFVTTMIAEPAYLAICAENDISPLCMPNFTGIIIFANIDGSFDSITMYEDGQVIDAEFINTFDTTSFEHCKSFATLARSNTMTKSDGKSVLHKDVQNEGDEDIAWDDILKECCVVAESKKKKEVNDAASNDGGYNGGGGSRNPDISIPNNGAGGTSSSSGSSSNSKKEKIEYCYLYIFSNDPNMGNVFPTESKYVKGSRLNVYAKPQKDCQFDYWTGDFEGLGEKVLVRQMNKDIESVAYFMGKNDPDTVKPCYDSLSKVMNPLALMSLAPTNTDGYTRGATFGDTRYENGKKKNHNGIDFAAPIGTNVYSMYSGKVIQVVKEQPNMIRGKDEAGKESWIYPDWYNGDKKKAGNRITIISTINEKDYAFVYCHLDSSLPIARNPRTGLTYKKNDPVFQGDLIGFTGKSGNAAGVPNPHLHLTVYSITNGMWEPVDPKDFINGFISPQDTKTKDGTVYGIKCQKKTTNTIMSIYSN